MPKFQKTKFDPESRVRVRRPRLARKRIAAIVAGASLIALSLAGCSAPAQNSTGAIEKLSDTSAVTVSYTGQVQKITVPSGVTSAVLTVKGASGYNRPRAQKQGWGGVVTGTLVVKGGDTLTVAVGQQGGANNGNKSPGAGGWSMPGSLYEGGSGGRSIGQQAWDGSGGGGASVVELNEKVTVVAAGGGGTGGRPDADVVMNGYSGGAGAYPAGQDGDFPAVDAAHWSQGGSSTWRNSARNGQNATHEESGITGGGGGGGGGGYYPGAGGKSGDELDPASGGGGGASWYSSDLQFAQATNPGDDHQNADGGNLGDGSISITWNSNPDTSKVVGFRKVGTRFPAVLQSVGAGGNGDGVDLGQQDVSNGPTFSASQLWTYQFMSQKQAGYLINKDTGLCLEVNGTDGSIDQWPCESPSANHLWYIANGPGADSVLLITLTSQTGTWAPGTYYLATAGSLDDVAVGATLTLEPTTSSRSTAWTAYWQ